MISATAGSAYAWNISNPFRVAQHTQAFSGSAPLITILETFDPMPRRNHPPKRKSRKPRPTDARRPAMDAAKPDLIEPSALAALAKAANDARPPVPKQ